MAKPKNGNVTTRAKQKSTAKKNNSEARTLSWCRAVEATPGLLSGVIFADDKVVLPNYGLVAEVNGRRVVKAYDMEEAKTGEDKGGNSDARNLSEGEEVRLSLHADSVKVATTVIIRSIFRAPYSCDHPETAEIMRNMANTLIDDPVVISKIAERIVFQILTGNVVWRNKTLFSDMVVKAEWSNEEDRGAVECKNGLEFPLTPVLSLSYKNTIGADSPHPVEVFMSKATTEIMRFVEIVEETLSGKRSRPLVIDVSVVGKASPGQSVYPSQAQTSEKMKRFQRYEDRLIISADKIQNALRRFDWDHSATPNSPSPLDSIIASVEPSGGTIDGPRVRGTAGRKPDFYGYKEAYLAHRTLPEELEEKIYLATCFIRGGVFVTAKKEEETKDTSSGSADSVETSSDNAIQAS